MVGSKTTLWIRKKEQGSRKMQKGRTTLKRTIKLNSMYSHDRIELQDYLEWLLAG
jgi:hypothetical protein